MKRTGKYYWKDLLKAYNEETTSTYHLTPGSKPLPSELGHQGVIEECDQE
jgi:hypothetical protein